MIEIDARSRLVTVGGEVRLCDLEAELARAGLTLGLLGGCDDAVGARLLSPSPLDRSPRYGRFADACVGLCVALADERRLTARTAPRKAAGPDWRALLGPDARVQEAVLRVHGLPEARTDFAWRFASRAAALTAAREAVRADVAPATWRTDGGVLAGRLEGPAAIVAVEQAQLADLAAAAGAPACDPPPRRCLAARFVPWSALLAGGGNAAEMCLDGGCLFA